MKKMLKSKNIYGRILRLFAPSRNCATPDFCDDGKTPDKCSFRRSSGRKTNRTIQCFHPSSSLRLVDSFRDTPVILRFFNRKLCFSASFLPSNLLFVSSLSFSFFSFFFLLSSPHFSLTPSFSFLPSFLPISL